MRNDVIFSEDEKTIVAVQDAEGNITPVPPAPTGDELDMFVNACCEWIEKSCRGRLAPELQPDADGRSSLTLVEGKDRWGDKLDYIGHEGVRSWIVDGTLRDISQLREVINDFFDAMEIRVRIKRFIDPKWKVDNDVMTILGSRFGLDLPKTFDELWAWKDKRRAANEQREAELAAERKRKHDEWAASPEGVAFYKKLSRDEFKREQLSTVLDELFPFKPIEYADPDNPTAEEKQNYKAEREANQAAAWARRQWGPYIQQVVEFD